MSNASKEFFAGGVKPAQFLTVGTTVSGIVESMHTAQQTEPSQDGSPGKPKTWADGNPAMMLCVVLQTNLRDDNDDDGRRTLYVRGQMRNAFQTAMRAVGRDQIDEGGTVTVTYVGDAERTSPVFNPAKQYQVSYVPPNPSAQYLGGNGAPQQAVPMPTYPPAQPQYVPQPVPMQQFSAPVSQQAPAQAPPQPVTQPAAASIPPPQNIPAHVWATLSPEAQAAMANIAAK